MKLKSIIFIPLALLLAGCGESVSKHENHSETTSGAQPPIEQCEAEGWRKTGRDDVQKMLFGSFKNFDSGYIEKQINPGYTAHTIGGGIHREIIHARFRYSNHEASTNKIYVVFQVANLGSRENSSGVGFMPLKLNPLMFLMTLEWRGQGLVTPLAHCGFMPMDLDKGKGFLVPVGGETEMMITIDSRLLGFLKDRRFNTKEGSIEIRQGDELWASIWCKRNLFASQRLIRF